ncbi:hypothetical protein DVH24_026783 [Malus domestica]|uniref:Uncharacterized protein n=2 Tax=Malus domestica TaxID=3750 RepID=A0A498K9H7_MALDO|nr:hypothetical protein DVH24_026783 [Malus domestica]
MGFSTVGSDELKKINEQKLTRGVENQSSLSKRSSYEEVKSFPDTSEKAKTKGIMAHQDEGWPLGLRPLNARVGLIRNRDLSGGSVSFSTLITASPTSSIASSSSSSSDLETEPTESFFHDKGITLGSLIGVSGILDLSGRSTRRRTTETSKNKKNRKTKPWLFSFCSKLTNDSVNVSNDTPSLGHFLEAERRASTHNTNRRNHVAPIEYGPEDFSPAVPVSGPNGLFVDGAVAAALPSPSESGDGGSRSNRELLEYGNGLGTPLLLSCLRGKLVK